MMKWMGQKQIVQKQTVQKPDRNVSEEEKFFQSGLIANEDGEFLSSLEEMETSGEDSMFFQDGLEVLEDGSDR